jgi:hypothetical protein
MKALSLKQPYAELVVSGKKTIELRNWNTKFRGEFLIHASKQVDKNAMKSLGFDELPLGCIIGKAFLADVKHYTSPEEHAKDKKKHLASTDWGNNGFVLKDAVRFELPIPCKGALNFWEFNGNIEQHNALKQQR